MISFRENGAFAFKYFYWSLIFIGLLTGGTIELIAWEGFTEPIDFNIYIDPQEERNYHQELADLINTPEDNGEEDDRPIKNEPD